MKSIYWILAMVAAVAIAVFVTLQFRPREPEAAPVQGYVPAASIRSIMEGIVDPSAGAIFASVAVISTAAGTVEHRPQTDEEWARVEHHALTLAESANLLMMPGRAVATPEEEKEPVQEGSLPPAQIAERIEGNRAQWNSLATAMMKVANRARDAARAHDVEGLYEVGGEIDITCEQCHLKLWYPDAQPFRRPLTP